MSTNAEITELGAQGDGTAMVDGERIHIPFSVPGDKVAISLNGNKGKLLEITQASPHRTEPDCTHFGKCGGCQLQHVEAQYYRGWKFELLTSALERQGIEHQPLPFAGPQQEIAKRRKVVLSAIKVAGRAVLGYQTKGSHKITELHMCPVMDDAIYTQLGGLKALCEPLLPKRGSIRLHILATPQGLDVAIESEKDGKGALGEAGRVALRIDIARLSVNGEVILLNRQPELSAGTQKLRPTPSAFVQANEQAQEVMIRRVMAHLEPCTNLADLFAGMGTFALSLAARSPVIAAESNAEAIKSLEAAWKASGGALKTIACEKRDLFVRPLMEAELGKIDGVVIDPPRAGALAQMQQLANSTVKRIASVSCNPVTFARDLKVLVDGGYTINSIEPIDQFTFTPHLEVVGLLEKE